MSRLLRLCLLLIVSLALPVNGMASVTLGAMPCPMEQPADPLQSAHAGHGEMHEPAAVSPSPADHMSDDGTCDMSQTCKSCNLLQLDLASTRTFLGASPTLHWADGDFVPSQVPDPRWRPPRA